ncbi:MAG: phosphoenolpyruvate synthase [Spirochaetae bacterium HGW-Spirochaetae-1]|jgi:hypothetical protein|nr:MAG: phosphoenolpyruvate synthase [Spirochaetae bacterium HGW-Spirochaetae-1]
MFIGKDAVLKPIVTASTGLEGLDHIVNNLNLGDNVVWQVDSIDDYMEFVKPFLEQSLKEGRKLVYMRFATHPPVVDTNDARIKTYQLNAFSGFESFAHEVYTIIDLEGEEAYYIFDCLSDLLSAWATDLMIGNFFVITCPHLFVLNTVAYFALFRNSHDYKTIARIRETTQLLIDIHHFGGSYYVHPLKVLNRYSPTMFFPHKKEGEKFTPIISSADAADFIHYLHKITTEVTKRNLDFWDRLFLEVEALKCGDYCEEDNLDMINRLCRIIIGRDERIFSLVRKHFIIDDFIAINDRLIGTGFIGGKTTGMLIARKMLMNDSGHKWHNLMEPHDSFYIGSDVFYTYIVQNGLWSLFMKHKTKEGYFTAAPELCERMMDGTFPDAIKEQFQQIIEYFGQSPFIVRSSSLLEDAYGHAFAGKYESYFCVNQGSPQERYQEFTRAIRLVYASTMNEDALAYRLQRGLDQMDEQMALLVQRVSGAHRRNYFFPDIGGVGLSYNTYVWKQGMDPEAGMMRIVFGLGTRAVNRVEGDYPRIVALDAPQVQPLSGMDDLRKFSQHDVDILNIETNAIETVPLGRLLSDLPELDMNRFAEMDLELAQRIRDMGLKEATPWLINFRYLLAETQFPDQMKELMQTIEEAYDYPVDIEFTVNFASDGRYKINLLQCRPYQAKGLKMNVAIPENIDEARTFFRSEGNFLGGSILQPITRIIYVDPEGYSRLNQSGKYDVARLVGKLNRLIDDRMNFPAMLIGPGRWGTTTPSLGVPVRFAEINNIRVLVELAQMSENVMPELSFGTHFFQDLVETEIFYIALFPEKQGVYLNMDFLRQYENGILSILPDSGAYADIVHVYDVGSDTVSIAADIISQRIVCYS